MTPVAGDVYDIPGQSHLIEVVAIAYQDETDYVLVAYKVNRSNHSDSELSGDITISKADFLKAKKVQL